MKKSLTPKPASGSKKDLVPGSRVPVTFLLDYFREGLSITDFIASYPWIKRKNIEKVIDEIKKRDFTSSHAL